MKVSLHPLATTDQRSHPNLMGLPIASLPPDPTVATRLARSFGVLLDHDGALAEVFYTRLFNAHPALRPMFPKDLDTQRQKLMATLAWVASHLSNRDAVLTAVTELGRRHARYGARLEHYPVVVETLLSAMCEVGGDAFDERAQSDWRTALTLIADHMIAAQQDATKQ